MLVIDKDQHHLLQLEGLVRPLQELGELKIIKSVVVEEAFYIIKEIESELGQNLEELLIRVQIEERDGIWKEDMEVQESLFQILNYQED